MPNPHTLLNENSDPSQIPPNFTANSVNSIMNDFRNFNMTGEITTYDLRKINLDPNKKFVKGIKSFTCSSLETPDFLKNNIKYIDAAINYFENIFSDEQRLVCNDMLSNIEKTINYNIFTQHLPENKAEHSILNAPAGTGKSMLLIYIALQVNKLMGCSSGCLIFSPSYAGVNALVDKLTEVFNEQNGYSLEESKHAINIVKSFLNVHVTNSYFSSGPKAFLAHDDVVNSQLIKNLGNTKLDYQKNNIIAFRKCKVIMFDEAFFSTVARFKSVFKFLDEGYLNNGFESKLFEDTKINREFFNNLKFTKNIVYCGDPCQLSIGVERVNVGSRSVQGKPIWYLQNKEFSRHSAMIDKIDEYKCYSLNRSFRFDKEQDKTLVSLIENIRVPYWTCDDEFESHESKMNALIDYMDSINLINYKSTVESITERVHEKESQGLTVKLVTEIHKAKNDINNFNNNEFLKIYIPAPIHCFNPNQITGLGTDIPLKKYLESDDFKEKKEEYRETFRFFAEDEYRNGPMANKYVGPLYPAELNGKPQELTKYTHSLYIGDTVRISYPVKNTKQINGNFPIVRMVGNRETVELSEEFRVETGDFAKAVRYDNDYGLIIEFNESETKKYMTHYNIPEKEITINYGSDVKKTKNLVIAIKHSKYLDQPYLKSDFYTHPIENKRFKLSVHCVPVCKSSASTLHSLQGQSYDKNTFVGYYMVSKITRSVLGDDTYFEDKSGPFKGSRSVFLYVAITRSRFPSSNFELFTEAKTKREFKKLLFAGTKPNSYNELDKFLSEFGNASQ